MKKLWKHGSTALLVIIVVILLVPSWRVSFQGWFQGIFMQNTYFESNSNLQLPATVENWEFEDMNGETHQFSEYNSQPIILSFWATWCPPCRAELVELKELQSTFGKTIHFISVSEEPLEVIKKSGLNDSYNFLYSADLFPRFFNVSAYPTLCIIDSRHQLIFQQEGSGDLNNEKNISFLKGLTENQ